MFHRAGYFGRFPLSVSLADALKNEEMDPSARMKQMADDGASMVKVLEMEQVFAQGGTVSAADLKKDEDTPKAAEDKL